MTGLTAQECTALLAHFAHALAAHLQARTIDGPPVRAVVTGPTIMVLYPRELTNSSVY
jgi:hypothetical protein